MIKGNPALQNAANSTKEKMKGAFRVALREITKLGSLHTIGIYGPPHPLNSLCTYDSHLDPTSLEKTPPLVISFISSAQHKRFSSVRRILL